MSMNMSSETRSYEREKYNLCVDAEVYLLQLGSYPQEYTVAGFQKDKVAVRNADGELYVIDPLEIEIAVKTGCSESPTPWTFCVGDVIVADRGGEEVLVKAIRQDGVNMVLQPLGSRDLWLSEDAIAYEKKK